MKSRTRNPDVNAVVSAMEGINLGTAAAASTDSLAKDPNRFLNSVSHLDEEEAERVAEVRERVSPLLRRVKGGLADPVLVILLVTAILFRPKKLNLEDKAKAEQTHEKHVWLLHRLIIQSINSSSSKC